MRAWRALPVRASDGEDARRCLSVWPATTRGGRRTSATFQAIKFLRSRMATIHRPFKRWKLETERDIFRKMKTRKRFQTHRSSAKSDRSKFSGGSDFFKGNFIPEDSGQIAAIFITDTALINYPGTDNINDDVWTVMTERVPDLETKVTLILAPLKEP